MAAAFLSSWLDGWGRMEASISPQDLERAALARRPMMLEALSTLNRGQAAAARAGLARFAAGMEHQDYLEILRILEWERRDHVQVLAAHLEWYREQMETARRWLCGTPPGDESDAIP
jgi:hypothetical protein